MEILIVASIAVVTFAALLIFRKKSKIVKADPPKNPIGDPNLGGGGDVQPPADAEVKPRPTRPAKNENIK